MIAADTSSLIAFFSGEKGKDVELIDSCLADGLLILPPPVQSELLSDPKLPKNLEQGILELPLMEQKKELWKRVAFLRRILLKKKLKARLADSLIAQFCIDHEIPLVTRDKDFKHFAKHSKLILI